MPAGRLPVRTAAGGGKDEGRLFGLAFHRLMELADFAAGTVPEPLARAAAEEFGLSSAEELARLAERTLGSKLLAEARSSGRAHREIPFTLVRGGAVVEGRIDLMYGSESGWRIVDYKTDDLPPGGIGARFDSYRGQGMLYALAASRLTGETVESVAFFFVRSGEIKEMRITGELLERFEEELSARSSG
ncbi:MAG TPA: hypothetical protein ENO08_03625 [Candidatus Eisenbacteria bacterium]|uniref:PD-(D/E)XK endonuclease-like domain-containing protein n=1 Tax=Eiseniibacteriota bacterium TaxID=2212470 RepID=A0A7V2AUN7_UNCEI|nr:hypothetical protein [Candidatus Eisenbacteria bacterium]